MVAVTNSYNNLGPVHHDLGDLKQENECHDRALNICLKELGPEHVDVANAYDNLGTVYHDLRDLPKAKEFQDHAYSISLKNLGL